MDERLRFYQPRRRVTEGDGDTLHKRGAFEVGENNRCALSRESLINEMLKLKKKQSAAAGSDTLVSLIFSSRCWSQRERD